MASKKVNIVDNTNEVSVTNSNNKIEIVNTNTPSNIEVTQRTTTLVQVKTAGPKGDRGPIGPAAVFDSGSYVTTGSFNSFTSSIQTEVDNLTSKTGSYATTGSNNFIGNQVITGSLTISGSSTFTNIGPAIFSGSIAVTNGNITSDGNITILGDLEADNFSTNGITRVGTQSGDSNSGDLITVLGYQSGKNNTGRQIVSIGYQSATDNSADYVSVLGYRAGYLNSGIYLSSVGYSAGRQNTGANQSSLGYTAGYINTGDNITVVGYQAGRQNSGNNIVAIGHQAGYLNTLDNQFIVRHSTANSIPLIQGNFESGSIGIGLTLPQSNLHVAGDIWASGSNGHITASGNISASSFIGDGSGLTNIPASSIVGLNLSQIVSGSVSASISPNNGFVVNTNTTILSSLTANSINVKTSTNTATLLSDTISGSFNYYFPPNSGGTLVLRDELPRAGNGLTDTIGFPSTISLGGDVTDNITLTDNLGSYIFITEGLGHQIKRISDSSGPSLDFQRAAGVPGSPNAPQVNHYLGIIGAGAATISESGRSAAIIFQATSDFTPESKGSSIGFYTTPSGSNLSSRIMTISDDGKVGIGTRYPTNTLHVSGSLLVTNSITSSALTSNDGQLFLGFYGDNNITIQEGGDFFINASSNSLELYGGSSEITVSNNGIRLNARVNATSHITASGNISSSATITANEFIGDGSGITGIVSSSYALTASYAENAGGGAGFPFEGDAVISGSLLVNAFSTTSQSLSVIGSGSTVFDVIGSVGTLFSVDDDLTGTLFSVNDISGFPILEASASGDVYIGKSPQSLYTTSIISSTTAATTHSLSSLSTSSYDGAFFEYTAHSGSNARAGNIMSTWNGGNIVYTETNTLDIGDTSDLTTEVIISGSTARLVAYGANAGYKIKTIIKAI